MSLTEDRQFTPNSRKELVTTNLCIGSNAESLAPKSKKRKTLFFPHWRSSCPYSFYERLTWSAAMDLARRNQDITCRKIAELTGLHQTTISKAIKRLAKDGLCSEPSNGKTIKRKCVKDVCGVECETTIDAKASGGRYPKLNLFAPADDSVHWWVKRKRNDKSVNWLNDMAYTIVEIDDSIGVVGLVLLAKMRGLKGKQSYKGLAAMLGMERKAIQRWVQRLIDESLITVEPTPDGYLLITPTVRQSVALSDDFNATLCPSNATQNPVNATLCPSNATQSRTSIMGSKEVLESNRENDCLSDEERLRRYDLADRTYLERLGCKPDEIKTILRYWVRYREQVINRPVETLNGTERRYGVAPLLGEVFSRDYLQQKNVKSPGWIVATLQEWLGDKPRKPPAVKPPPLTWEEEEELQFTDPAAYERVLNKRRYVEKVKFDAWLEKECRQFDEINARADAEWNRLKACQEKANQLLNLSPPVTS